MKNVYLLVSSFSGAIYGAYADKALAERDRDTWGIGEVIELEVQYEQVSRPGDAGVASQ